MKQKVIEFFQNLPVEKHEQFNEAFKLYRDSPNKNVLAERSYNSSGYTERSLENLMYDLQKLHDVSDVEKVTRLQIADVSKKVTNYSKNDLEVISNLSDDEILKWSKGDVISFEEILEVFDYAVSVENHEAIVVLNKIIDSIEPTPEGVLKLNPDSEVPGTQEQTSTELNPASTEAGTTSTEPDSEIKGNPVVDAHDLTDALKIENEELKSENEDLQSEKEELEDVLRQAQDDNEELKTEVETLKLAPKLDAKQIRVEFPFLNEKDCPDEFKILIADKITAWNAYLTFQEEIAAAESGEKPQTNEVLAIMANEAVKCFDENQKIYDELNCYQTTGKILGVHPIFKKLQLTREIETMTNDELIKYKASSAKYFSVKKGALTKAKKAKDTAKIAEIEAGVAERHDKLFLVNKKLGV